MRSPSLPAALLATTLLALSALVVTGCDDDPSDPAAVPPDTPSRELLTGESLVGEALTVRVVSAVPDPPLRSDVNIWRLAVVDGAGEPVEGCEVEVEPTMPAHGHGTTPTPTVTAVDGEAGVYEARPLNLFMPGEWHIAVRPSCGSTRDEVVFVVDIQS